MSGVIIARADFSAYQQKYHFPAMLTVILPMN
jgi:hypothetical protein